MTRSLARLVLRSVRSAAGAVAWVHGVGFMAAYTVGDFADLGLKLLDRRDMRGACK